MIFQEMRLGTSAIPHIHVILTGQLISNDDYFHLIYTRLKRYTFLMQIKLFSLEPIAEDASAVSCSKTYFRFSVSLRHFYCRSDYIRVFFIFFSTINLSF